MGSTVAFPSIIISIKEILVSLYTPLLPFFFAEAFMDASPILTKIGVENDEIVNANLRNFIINQFPCTYFSRGFKPEDQRRTIGGFLKIDTFFSFWVSLLLRFLGQPLAMHLKRFNLRCCGFG
jgi:hypothetical protein